MSSFKPPGECPVCGAAVPARARSCPECGASEADGWSDETDADGLDLPGHEDDAADAPQDGSEPPSQAFNIMVVVVLILIFTGLWFVF